MYNCGCWLASSIFFEQPSKGIQSKYISWFLTIMSWGYAHRGKINCWLIQTKYVLNQSEGSHHTGLLGESSSVDEEESRERENWKQGGEKLYHRYNTNSFYWCPIDIDQNIEISPHLHCLQLRCVPLWTEVSLAPDLPTGVILTLPHKLHLPRAAVP